MYEHITIQKSNENWKSAISDVYINICGRYENEPNHYIKRDKIEDYILIYCTKGKGFLNCRGIKKEVSAGDLLFIEKNIAHEYGSDTAQPWSIFWMHLTGAVEVFYRIYWENNFSPISHPGYLPRLVNLFKDMLAQAQSHLTPLDNLKANENARLILLESLSLPAENSDELMKECQEYLCSHAGEKLTLDDLSEKLHMSKYHLLRRFKRYSGYTPIEFYFRQKVNLASLLLIQDDVSIGEISRRLSYATPYYFSKQFKQITGYSPTEFRAMFAKEER